MAFVQAPYGFDVTVGFPTDKRYVIDSGNPWDAGNVSQYSAYEGILVYSKSLDKIYMFTGAISASDFDANKTALETESNWTDLTAGLGSESVGYIGGAAFSDVEGLRFDEGVFNLSESGDNVHINLRDSGIDAVKINKGDAFTWTAAHTFQDDVTIGTDTILNVPGASTADQLNLAGSVIVGDSETINFYDDRYTIVRHYINRPGTGGGNISDGARLHETEVFSTYNDGDAGYQASGFGAYIHEVRYGEEDSVGRGISEWSVQDLSTDLYTSILLDSDYLGLESVTSGNVYTNIFHADSDGISHTVQSGLSALELNKAGGESDNATIGEIVFKATDGSSLEDFAKVRGRTVDASGRTGSLHLQASEGDGDGDGLKDYIRLNHSGEKYIDFLRKPRVSALPFVLGDILDSDPLIESGSIWWNISDDALKYSDESDNTQVVASRAWVNANAPQTAQILQNVRTDGGHLGRDTDGDVIGVNDINFRSNDDLQIAYDTDSLYRRSDWTSIVAGDKIRIINSDRSSWGVYTANGAGSDTGTILRIAGGITLVSGTDVMENASEGDSLSVEIYVDNKEVVATFTDNDAGLVPAPLASGDEDRFLKGDGTWADAGETYTAGTNVQISDSNVISSTDTTYTGGDGISIDDDNVIAIDLEDSLSGLEITDTGLGIDLDDDGGLSVIADGLTLTLNGTTLTKNSSGVRINYDHQFVGNTAWSRMHLKDNTNTSDPQSLVTREDLNNHTFVTPVVHSGDPNTLANLETDTSSTITWTTNDTSGTAFSGDGARAFYFQPTELGDNSISIGDSEDFSIYTNTSSHVVDSTNSTVIRVVGENAVLNDSSDFTIPTYLSINTLEPVETYIEIRRRPAANVNWGSGTSVNATPTVGTPIFRSEVIDVTNGTYTRDYTMSLVGGQTANFDKDDMLIVNFVIISTNGSNTIGNSIFSFGALDDSDHEWSLDFTTHHYDDIFEFETGGDVRIRINDGDGNFDDKKIYDATNDLILGLPRAPEDEATYDLVVNSDGDPSWTERSDDLTVEDLTVNGNTTLGNAAADTVTVNATTTFKSNSGVTMEETSGSAELELYSNSPFNSLLDGYQTGIGGLLKFHAPNSDGDNTRYASIQGISVANTANDEEGRLSFYVRDPNGDSNSLVSEKIRILYDEIQLKQPLVLESINTGSTEDGILTVTSTGEVQTVAYPSEASDQFANLGEFVSFANNDAGVTNSLSIANINSLAALSDTDTIITDNTFVLSGNAGKAVVVSSDQTQLTLSSGAVVDADGSGINGTPTDNQIVAWDNENSRLYWKDDSNHIYDFLLSGTPLSNQSDVRRINFTGSAVDNVTITSVGGDDNDILNVDIQRLAYRLGSDSSDRSPDRLEFSNEFTLVDNTPIATHSTLGINKGTAFTWTAAHTFNNNVTIGNASGDSLNVNAGTVNFANITDGTIADGKNLGLDSSGNLVTATVSGGGGEANQNAFSNVAVSGQTTVAADTTTDTLTLVGGVNTTITTDADSDSVTIDSDIPEVPTRVEDQVSHYTMRVQAGTSGGTWVRPNRLWVNTNTDRIATPEMAKANFAAFKLLSPVEFDVNNFYNYTQDEADLTGVTGVSVGDLARIVRQYDGAGNDDAGYVMKTFHYDTDGNLTHEYLIWIQDEASSFSETRIENIFTADAALNKLWSSVTSSNKLTLGAANNEILSTDWAGYNTAQADTTPIHVGTKRYYYDDDGNLIRIAYDGKDGNGGT